GCCRELAHAVLVRAELARRRGEPIPRVVGAFAHGLEIDRAEDHLERLFLTAEVLVVEGPELGPQLSLVLGPAALEARADGPGKVRVIADAPQGTFEAACLDAALARELERALENLLRPIDFALS